MMPPRFPLFHSHLDLAHSFWERIVQKSDFCIDATAGNGHDTFFLASLLDFEAGGRLLAIDAQSAAIKQAQTRCAALPWIEWLCQCHSKFPERIREQSARLIVYNLGYLPGADKSKTTSSSTTLASIQAALSLLSPGGLCSITCYPGHREGQIEEEALQAFCATLPKELWQVSQISCLNRAKSPSLLLLQKQHEPKQTEKRVGMV